MTMTFDLDEAAARITADPLDRAMFNLLGRERTHVGYAIVVTLMNEMVEAGIIDPEWIVDLSREPLIWRGYDSVAHALREKVAGYFKNLWLNEPPYVQVWVEKQG
jgi:hypothetical protein